jgi:MGT family glycosyltransferase
MQIVITLGGRRDPASLGVLPGNPLIVQNAPQLDLLELAKIVVTHAGPNTVLETLLQGKPMVALPLALDQPAVAAHLTRLKVAEVVRVDQCSAKTVRTALLKVRNNSRYREASRALQTQLKSLRGPSQAADIIEAKLAGFSRTLLKTDRAMTIA